MKGIWIITAIVLLTVGALLFCNAMTTIKWDFRQLSTASFTTNSYSIDQDFSNISLDVGTASVVLLPAADGKTSVVVYEDKNDPHTVTVENNLLVIKRNREINWNNRIGIQFQSPKITLTLPQNEYGTLVAKLSTGDIDIHENFRFESMDITASTGSVVCRASASGDVNVKLSTGSILLENISAAAFDLSVTTGTIKMTGIACESELFVGVSTGKAYLTDVTCRTLTSTGDTGDLSLRSVIASKKFLIERTTGDVTLDRCDAAEIFIATDTGDVTGTLLSDKIFFTQTSTGKIDVPKSTSGGSCEIVTSTGDITITLS